MTERLSTHTVRYNLRHRNRNTRAMDSGVKSFCSSLYIRMMCEKITGIGGESEVFSLTLIYCAKMSRHLFTLLEPNFCLQCGRPGFDSWVGKILWRRKWQPTLVLLPGKSHGWRCLVGYSLWGHKELDTTE